MRILSGREKHVREVRGGGNRSFACRRRASWAHHLGSLSRVLFRYALYRKPQYSEWSVQSRQNMTSNYHAIISYDLRPQKIYENYKNILQFALLPFVVALLEFLPVYFMVLIIAREISSFKNQT